MEAENKRMKGCGTVVDDHKLTNDRRALDEGAQ